MSSKIIVDTTELHVLANKSEKNSTSLRKKEEFELQGAHKLLLFCC